MKSLIPLILVIELTFVAQARVNSIGESAFDSMIYTETKEVCSQSRSSWQAIFNSNTWRSFLISTGQSLSLVFGDTRNTIETFETMAQTNMIGIYAADRLNSYGFIRAVNECFPNNPKLKSSFVLSMLVADNLGKVPTIVSFIYFSKIYKVVMANIPPKLSLTLKLGLSASALLFAVLESRNQIKDRVLTDYEKKRVNQITSGMKENVEATGKLVTELAREELESLENLYNGSQSPEEKAQIKIQIEKIQALLKQV